MYLYVIINSAKRALFMLNTWPQTLRPISVADKNMYLCKKQCSIYKALRSAIALTFLVKCKHRKV